MSSFILKIIAVISMLFDHCGYIFFHKITFMNVIGKISFPIFAFQISEGYKYTKNLKRYLLRLFVFAIVSQIPFTLFLNCLGTTTFTLNIFFTLFLGLLSMAIYDKLKNKLLGLFIVLLLTIMSQITHCDYGWFGVTIIFLFYLFKNHKLLMNLSIILSIILKYSIAYIQYPTMFNIYFIVSSCLSLLFINLYNHKKGRNIKYLLYILYPLHLLFLYVLSFFFVNLL